MNRFETFFRQMYGDEAVSKLDPQVSFTDALQDLPQFIARENERELTDWLFTSERRRLERLKRNTLGLNRRNPETLKAKYKRKRAFRKLRDKQIVARVSEVGYRNLTRAERADLAAASRRSAAQSRRNA
jgi:indole-3-glycerol phosphate synthase